MLQIWRLAGENGYHHKLYNQLLLQCSLLVIILALLQYVLNYIDRCFKRMYFSEYSSLLFQLIEPEELISPAVDEKSVMTYLSQFPGAKYTPLLGRLHDVVMMPVIGVTTRFTFRTRDAMVVPEIFIKGPNESLVHHTQYQLSETVYEFKYQPETPGEHKVIILLFV